MRKLLLVALVSMAMNACSEANDATMLTGTAEPVSPDMMTTEGAVPDGASIGEDEPGNSVEQQVLAELVVGEEQINFLQLGSAEDAPLALQVSGPADRGSVLDALYAREGELTQLEVFQALAPAGSIPPPALVAAHADQLAAMGRIDDGVRVVDKAVALNPPAGKTACDLSLIFDARFVWNPVNVLAPFGNAFLCTGTSGQGGSGSPTSSSCTEFTTRRQRVGACSINGAISAGVGFGNAATWTVNSTTVLAPNQYVFWEFTPSTTPRRLAAVGFASVIYGLRAGIGG